MTVRVYLAGPEVFLANAREVRVRKRAVCARHGLVGVTMIAIRPCSLAERGLSISCCMQRIMGTCDATIVNLTPFPRPSTDVGSAYEMSFMRALGRPILAYSNVTDPSSIV